MTALDYASDVSDLAEAVLPVLDELPRPERSGSVGVHLLELHITASRARETTAPQQALQLTFDAAQIAALHPEAIGDPAAVAELLDHPDIVLTLMWAGSGSLRQLFVVDPLTEDGRASIRYVFLIGFFVLACIPGGGAFAAAYGLALESILLVGRLREKAEKLRTTLVRTVDEVALGNAPTDVSIIPPGRTWHPPGHADPDEQWAEQFAQLRDRVAHLEEKAQHDRAEIGRLRAQLARRPGGFRPG